MSEAPQTKRRAAFSEGLKAEQGQARGPSAATRVGYGS